MGFEREALKKTVAGYLQDPEISVSEELLKHLNQVIEYGNKFGGFYLADGPSRGFESLQVRKINNRKRSKITSYEHSQINGELVLPKDLDHLESLLERNRSLAIFRDGKGEDIQSVIVHNGICSWDKHFQIEGLNLIGYGRAMEIHKDYSQTFDWQAFFSKESPVVD